MIFVGLRVFDGLAFSQGIDVSMLICADGGGRVESTRSEYGLEVRSLEDSAGFVRKWTGEERDTFAEPLLKETAGSAPGTAVATYAPSPVFDRLAESGLPLEILSTPSRISRQFDNKRISKRLFRTLGIPVADFMEGPLDGDLLKSAFDTLGVPVVVRLPFGNTGLQTFLCSSVDQAMHEFTRSAIRPRIRALIERFEPGPSLNINAVAFRDGERLFEPSIQIIGAPSCSSRPFLFCGSDYRAAGALPPEITRRCFEYTRAVGAVMRRKGFRGLFGLDFTLAGENRLLACEINPRMQNSTALINWSCTERRHSPAALHVAAVRGEDAPRRALVTALGEPLCQVIAYADEDCIAAETMAEGRFGLGADGRLSPIDPGTDPRALSGGEVLVLGGPAKRGLPYERGGVVFRVILRQQAVDPATGKLAPCLSRLVRRLKSRLLEGAASRPDPGPEYAAFRPGARQPIEPKAVE